MQKNVFLTRHKYVCLLSPSLADTLIDIISFLILLNPKFSTPRRITKHTIYCIVYSH
jgi:hypothetical protein